MSIYFVARCLTFTPSCLRCRCHRTARYLQTLYCAAAAPTAAPVSTAMCLSISKLLTAKKIPRLCRSMRGMFDLERACVHRIDRYAQAQIHAFSERSRLPTFIQPPRWRHARLVQRCCAARPACQAWCHRPSYRCQLQPTRGRCDPPLCTCCRSRPAETCRCR